MTIVPKPPSARPLQHELLQPMTKHEAVAITRKINLNAGALAELLTEAHERLAWSAMGYSSWREYATGELSISQSRAYQLLNQGQVQAALSEAVSTKVEIPESVTRDIKKRDIPRIAKDAKRRVQKGATPKAAARAAVKAARKPKAAKPPARKPSPPVIPFPVRDEFAPNFEHEFRDAQERVEQLETELKALRATDRAGEIMKWVTKYRALEGRLRGAMATSAEAQKQAKYGTLKLAAIRTLLKVESNKEILPAIRALQ